MGTRRAKPSSNRKSKQTSAGDHDGQCWRFMELQTSTTHSVTEEGYCTQCARNREGPARRCICRNANCAANCKKDATGRCAGDKQSFGDFCAPCWRARFRCEGCGSNINERPLNIRFCNPCYRLREPVDAICACDGAMCDRHAGKCANWRTAKSRPYCDACAYTKCKSCENTRAMQAGPPPLQRARARERMAKWAERAR